MTCAGDAWGRCGTSCSGASTSSVVPVLAQLIAALVPVATVLGVSMLVWETSSAPSSSIALLERILAALVWGVAVLEIRALAALYS